MRILRQTLLIWSAFMLMAYSGLGTPIARTSNNGSSAPAGQAQAAQAVLADKKGNHYWIVTAGGQITLYKILLTSDAGVTPRTYSYVLSMETTQLAPVLTYLKAQGVKL